MRMVCPSQRRCFWPLLLPYRLSQCCWEWLCGGFDLPRTTWGSSVGSGYGRPLGWWCAGGMGSMTLPHKAEWRDIPHCKPRPWHWSSGYGFQKPCCIQKMMRLYLFGCVFLCQGSSMRTRWSRGRWSGFKWNTFYVKTGGYGGGGGEDETWPRFFLC